MFHCCSFNVAKEYLHMKCFISSSAAIINFDTVSVHSVLPPTSMYTITFSAALNGFVNKHSRPCEVFFLFSFSVSVQNKNKEFIVISENHSALQLKEKYAAHKYQNTHQWYLNKQTNIQVLKTSLKAGLELVEELWYRAKESSRFMQQKSYY